ncbi:MAG: TIGR00270 family protein [Candidatus Helarchaeota archaeon]|nr:TIGR00270 family protein [Candidatus Helarchaeota archaeon]
MPENESTCDICGRPIFGKPVYKYIEGAKLEVCQNCSRFGKSAKSPKTISSTKPRYVKRKKARYIRDKYKGDIFLIENFGKIIKEAREKRKMTQNDFARALKEPLSLIRRIEQNKINPSLKVVKKIENLLNITLTERDVEEYYPKPSKKPKNGTTIGDIVQIKKKKE